MPLPCVRSLLCWLVLLAVALPPAEAQGEGAAELLDKALCPVCRVHEGESEMEEVKATADFEGETYGFCSETCRDTFQTAPAPYLPPAFPRPAPAFQVADLNGKAFTSEALQGKLTLLDFWASWCLPCVVDLPKLTALHQRLEDQGFQVLSISIDEGKNSSKKIAKLIKKKKIAHPVFLDGGDSPAWEAYLVAVVPTQFLVDREGKIVAQWSGVMDLEEVERAVVERLRVPEAGG